MKISITAPTITAPWMCCIFTIQPASLSAAIPQIAMAGARKEKVPPWTMGRRLP